MNKLVPERLTKSSFTPFGDVLEVDGAQQIPINQGTTTRFHKLSMVETGDDGAAILSIFRGTPRPFPIEIKMLERHPLGSQAFMPLSDRNWLVVVAEEADVKALRCFYALGNQGVQYNANVWHHPLLVLQPMQDFLIVDRSGPGENLEEVDLATSAFIEINIAQ